MKWPVNAVLWHQLGFYPATASLTSKHNWMSGYNSYTQENKTTTTRRTCYQKGEPLVRLLALSCYTYASVTSMRVRVIMKPFKNDMQSSLKVLGTQQNIARDKISPSFNNNFNIFFLHRKKNQHCIGGGEGEVKTDYLRAQM